MQKTNELTWKTTRLNLNHCAAKTEILSISNNCSKPEAFQNLRRNRVQRRIFTGQTIEQANEDAQKRKSIELVTMCLMVSNQSLRHNAENLFEQVQFDGVILIVTVFDHQARKLHKRLQSEKASLFTTRITRVFVGIIAQQTIGNIKANFNADFEEFADCVVGAQQTQLLHISDDLCKGTLKVSGHNLRIAPKLFTVIV